MVAAILLVAGAGKQPIQATAVDSVMQHIRLSRPLAEWCAFGRNLDTATWLRRLVGPLSRWIYQHQSTMVDVQLVKRLFVERATLYAWLKDRTQRELRGNEVASNLGKIFGIRAMCKPTKLFSFCGQTVCS